MANYANLKSDIAGVIRTNNNEEITGDILQEQLFNMVDELGAGFQYKGVATPTTAPGTPDENVFYIASTAGTYTNFGGLVVADGEVAILKYNGSWAKEVTGAATAAQVTQLGQDVGDLRDEVGDLVVKGAERIDLPFTTESGAVIAVPGSSFGKSSKNASYSRTNFINIDGFQGNTLVFSQAVKTETGASMGLVFYTSGSQNAGISPGYPEVAEGESTGLTEQEVTIPSNATCFRFTIPVGFESQAYCYVKINIDGYDGGIGERVEALESLVPFSKNLLNPATISKGKYIATGGGLSGNTSYDTSDYIPTLPYQKLFINFAVIYAFYTKGKGFISGTRVQTDDVAVIQAPANAYYLRVSFSSVLSSKGLVAQADKIVKYIPFGRIAKESVLPEVNLEQLGGILSKTVKKVSIASLTEGNALQEEASPRFCKWGDTFALTANIVGAFGSIVMGRGYKSHTGRYIEIDGTNITLTKCNTSAVETVVQTIPHGISTFSTYLKVMIYCKNDGTAFLVLQTLSESKTFSLDWAYDDSGIAFVLCKTGELAEVNFEAGNTFLSNPVWVLGDSLVTPSSDRWTGILHGWGFRNYCLAGLSGGHSSDLFDELERMAKMGCPKYLFWAVGTNDYGHPQVFESYLNRVVQLCDDNGIALTLALVPDAPNHSPAIDLSPIRTYCLSKGVPCVDFYSAVTQNTATGEWYPGYQSADDLHPAIPGAEAEASQVLMDFPQIMM